ncbi:MAG: anthranilate phosphoribosyltransferase [Myxococcota bacterium]|nr:anthranilate phosphoribosyltransferase [Myxococcota bacterium]
MNNYLHATKTLFRNEDLGAELAEAVMEEIMTGQLNDVQIASFLSALATKKETASEFLGMAKVLRRHASSVSAEGDLFDTCGTGGSGLDTPNTSTLSALVVATAGVKVAKHGNRSSSGRCGSADVLEKAGVNISLGKVEVEQLLLTQNFVFMLAPLFHPAMKFAGPVRKQMGVRTSFNFLGPLANPANVSRQVLGVSDLARAPLIAEALAGLGLTRALVVHGLDGLDEITTTCPTAAWLVQDGHVESFEFNPDDLGIRRAAHAEITGGDTQMNLEIFEQTLRGTVSTAICDLVSINAGAALWIADIADSIANGYKLAVEIVRSGKLQDTLSSYKDLSNELSS